MKIEPIIYETTRELRNVEDKIKITNIFLFCYKKGNIYFAELLYSSNHAKYIEKLENEFSKYDIDLKINLNDKNIKNAFYKTIEKVKEKHDENGYYLALYQKDEFAVMIENILKRSDSF